MNTTLIFYDSDCLSSFLKINKADLLKKLFKEVKIPKQVYDELTTPDSHWYIIKNVKKLEKEGFLKIIPIETNLKQLKDYNSMISGKWSRPIGKGEAAALTLAISKNGIIASNNLRDVKKIAKSKNIPIMTSSIILTAIFETGILTKKETENIWSKMLKKNTKLPNKTFDAYYKKQFKKDYKEFNLKKYYKKLIAFKYI